MNKIIILVKKIKRKIGKIIFKILAPAPLLISREVEEEDFVINSEDDIKREVKRSIPSEKDIKRVEIIVLKYKEPEVETRCAQKIIENTQWPYKLTIYDNRRGTRNMSKIWNKLIKESTCDYVLIMDSDVFVPKLDPCWLTRMMGAFANSDCFVVVPKVSKTSSIEQRGPAEKGLPRKMKSVFAAQCVLYKKDIFERVGYFDEEFLFYGQDTEWSARLIKMGLNAYLVPEVSVEHLKHYSISKAFRDKEINVKLETKYAERLLREKIQ